MPFLRTPDHLYLSSILAGEAWLSHGFGTARGRPPLETRTLRQIHSCKAFTTSEWQPDLQGDALMAGEPGVWVGVKTADCVPVLIADRVNRAVAAVHAGWRGTVADVAGEALRRMGEIYKTNPKDVVAAIGPGIRSCCFEVGPEVSVQFATLFPERSDLEKRTQIDLEEANRRLLIRAGVPEQAIDTGAPCTVCRSDEFYSWRRERTTQGRMISAIARAE